MYRLAHEIKIAGLPQVYPSSRTYYLGVSHHVIVPNPYKIRMRLGYMKPQVYQPQEGI